MIQLNNTNELCNKKWHSEFLNGRFKVTVTIRPDGRNLDFEWEHDIPWDMRMAPKTAAKFNSEYETFITVVCKEYTRLIESDSLLLCNIRGEES